MSQFIKKEWNSIRVVLNQLHHSLGRAMNLMMGFQLTHPSRFPIQLMWVLTGVSYIISLSNRIRESRSCICAYLKRFSLCTCFSLMASRKRLYRWWSQQREPPRLLSYSMRVSWLLLILELAWEAISVCWLCFIFKLCQ